MSIGSVTLLAIAAAALATLLWWIAAKLSAPAWVGMFVYGVAPGAGHHGRPADQVAVTMARTVILVTNSKVCNLPQL